MFARFNIPKAANLDAAIRDFRALFDKVNEIYYPKKDVRGRRGWGDFVFTDKIKDWHFISTWCEVHADMMDEPECKVSVSGHTPKGFGQLAKLFASQYDSGGPFLLTQSIAHRESPECRLDFWCDRYFPGRENLVLDISESILGKKLDPANVESALNDLWGPTVKQFANCSQLTIIPSAAGTKFKATQADVEFSKGKLTKQFDDRDDTVNTITEWAKWGSKLRPPLKMFCWSFDGTVVETDALKLYSKFQKIDSAYTTIDLVGRYHKDFVLESVGGKYPVEGYWRFPLFNATAGLVGAYAQVHLLLTPNGNFFEYGVLGDTHVERLKTHKKLKGKFSVSVNPHGCTAGSKSLNELFAED